MNLEKSKKWKSRKNNSASGIVITPEMEMERQNIIVPSNKKPELTKEDIVNYFESFENINQLPKIEDAIQYLQNKFKDDMEEFYGNRFEGFIFTLRDGTVCDLTYAVHECILHTYSEKKYFESGEYIYETNDTYICASCLTKLQPKPNILRQYDMFTNEYFDDSEKILFPIDWTDEGIHSWCKKRQKKQSEHVHRELEKAYSNNDCSNCEHMIKSECEYGLGEYKLGCESWE